MAKVFIAYSGDTTRKVANTIHFLLSRIGKKFRIELFRPENMFLSVLNMRPGEAQKQIDQNLKNVEIGIPILSKENYGAPWLMYEVGSMINGAGENKSATIIPFLFCRHITHIEPPLQYFQVYQYQHNEQRFNIEQFKKFAQAIVQQATDQIIDELELDDFLDKFWEQKEKNFNQIAVEMHDAVSMKQKRLDNQANHVLNTAVFESEADMFQTENQSPYGTLVNDFSKKQYTPGTLKDIFKNALDFISEDWLRKDSGKFKDAAGVPYDVHRVIINETRISTFVTFTDGKNILLFDRQAAPNVTNVTNQRYDVFGSVQFENRSIEIKIPSKAFLNAPILKIKPIYGAAFEDNLSKTSSKRETVVMFGIFAYLSEEDLQLALEANDALFIEPIETANAYPDTKLTSKALLSVKQLVSSK